MILKDRAIRERQQHGGVPRIAFRYFPVCIFKYLAGLSFFSLNWTDVSLVVDSAPCLRSVCFRFSLLFARYSLP